MRLEAKIKMGYYPTPLSVVDRIRSFLRFPQDSASLFDPCCGEGMALKTLAGNDKVTTYGIELDEYRAEQARSHLDQVLKGSYEDSRISNNAFSCLFLNPPYDWDTPAEQRASERKEKTFLKGTVKYLQPRGVLVYIIPQHRMTDDVARIVSYRFEDCNAFRFPDDEYQTYKQIVLFGAKKHRSSQDENDFASLKNIPAIVLDEIPYSDTPLYSLPSSKTIHLFRSSVIDEGELRREMADSILWQRLNGYDGTDNDNIGRPPLPLHTGHLGLLLANGYLDGVVGEGQDRHIVRGKVEKITNKYDEYKGDVLIEREVDSYRVSVKILRKDGNILTLM